MSNIGTKFEEDLAKEFGLTRVPGSGNQFQSKLDIQGKGARWSLKTTGKKSITFSQEIVDEAVDACFGLNGDGSIPVWALRMETPEYDLIILRKEDFKALQKGELQLITEETGKDKVNQRRLRSKTPSLFRNDE
jgi:hypothetical protein